MATAPCVYRAEQQAIGEQGGRSFDLAMGSASRRDTRAWAKSSTMRNVLKPTAPTKKKGFGVLWPLAPGAPRTHRPARGARGHRDTQGTRAFMNLLRLGTPLIPPRLTLATRISRPSRGVWAPLFPQGHPCGPCANLRHGRCRVVRPHVKVHADAWRETYMEGH